MYFFIATVGAIIRNGILPNPFVFLGESAEIVNIIATIAIAVLSYWIVGKVFGYESGDCPAFGSLLYTLVYSMIIFAIYEIGENIFFAFGIVTTILLAVGLTRILLNPKKVVK